MSIDMYLEDSQKQVESVSNETKNTKEDYVALISAISSFLSDTESLKGKAYDSAREYYQAVLLPLARGGELYAEAVDTAVSKFTNSYIEQVDSKSWQEQELRDLISQEQQMLRSVQDMLSTRENAVSKLGKQLSWEEKNDSVILIRGHQANIQAFEEILTNLIHFHEQSPSIFSEAESLKAQLDKGLAQVKDSWDAKNQTFRIPKDLSWRTHLDIEWNLKKGSKSDKFIANLQKQYGFDEKTAKIMYKLYKNIKKLEGDNTDYVFNRLMGGIVYDEYDINIKNLSQSSKSYIFALFFMHTAGLGSYWGDGLKSRMQIKTTFYLSEEEADYLIKVVSDLHIDSKGKNDFAHQSIIIASMLYKGANLRLSNFIGIFRGKGLDSDFVDQLIGWRGDITNQAFADPSLSNDDYTADLDAVNIVAIMRKKKVDYISASNYYYNQLEKGQITRASAFDKNVGIDYVEREVLQIYGVNTLHELYSMNPIAYNFIMSLRGVAGKNPNFYHNYLEDSK